MRLVDLTGEVLRSFQVPGRYQAFATADEVLVGRGGRVYVADEAGIRPVAVGYLNGTSAMMRWSWPVTRRRRAPSGRQPTDGGSSRALLAIEDPDLEYHEAVTAPDGRVAVVGYAHDPRQRQPHHRCSTPRARRSTDRRGPRVAPAARWRPEGTPQWLPDDLGLVVRTAGALGWLRPDGSEWTARRDPLVAGTSDASFFVVTP